MFMGCGTPCESGMMHVLMEKDQKAAVIQAVAEIWESVSRESGKEI